MNQGFIETATRQVTRLVATRFALNESSLDPDVLLFDDLALGSKALVELMVALEDEFGIALPSLEHAAPRTLGDLVELVLEQTR